MQLPAVLRSHTRQRGFSLVELMVVLVIIGILSAIAYPAYTRYVVRTHRAAAQSYMLNMALTQNSYFADARAYGSDAQIKALLPVPSEVASRYTITTTPGTTLPPSYTITAVPVVGKSQAADGDLSLNNLGVKTPAASW